MKGDSASGSKADPFKRFNAALRQIVSVSKTELQKREAAYKRQRARKRKRAKS